MPLSKTLNTGDWKIEIMVGAGFRKAFYEKS